MTTNVKPNIALVMITMDRTPKENYLPQTFANMKRAGVFQSDRLGYSALVFSTASIDYFNSIDDRVKDETFHKLDVPPVDAPRSACENAGRALALGGQKAIEHGLEWVLFCEDDLDFCADFLESVSAWLEKYGESETYRVFSFGCPYPQVKNLAECRKDRATDLVTEACWSYPYNAFYGTQCFAIRPEDAISLGTYIASNPTVGGVRNPNAYDLMFHDWMIANYPDGAFLASVPSFVQHIGRQSICTGLEKTHTFDSWPGREWCFRHYENSKPDHKKLLESFLESDTPQRILWVGDSPTVNTGFSICTRKVCEHLHQSGWDVHVLGLSYFGDPHQYPYKIYPAVNPLDNSRDAYGCMRLPKLIHQLKPDVVVLLNDPWNVEAYLYNITQYERETGVQIRDTFKLVGWLAVDGKNTSAEDFDWTTKKKDGSLKHGRLDHLAVWTEFAKQELESNGWNGPAADVIPLGVDTSVFYPVNKQAARAKILPPGVPADAFIIGVVGRNQYRKRLDLCIQYFAEWAHSRSIENAYLYLHCAPTGDKGVDIRSLVKYYNISKRVILAQTLLGIGATEEQMRLTYNSFDLKLSLSQGEGFDLTTLEAMACGVLTMGADWSGLASWTGEAMIKIPCTSTAMTAPYGSLLYTIGGIADKQQTIEWFDSLHSSRQSLRETLKAASELVNELTWKNTATRFEKMLQRVLQPQIRATETEWNSWKNALKTVHVPTSSASAQDVEGAC